MSCAAIFPLEMDLSWETFEYESETSNTGKIEDDDDEVYTTIDTDVDDEAQAELVSAEINLRKLARCWILQTALRRSQSLRESRRMHLT